VDDGAEPGDEVDPDDSEAGDPSASSAPAGGGAGGTGGGGPSAPAGDGRRNGGEGTDGAGAEGPAELLGEVRAIRRRARFARHAYWFPLVLFGALICASVPFYIQRIPRGRATFSSPSGPPGPRFLQSGYLGGFGFGSYRGTAYYWLGALLLGVVATVVWYRWRGNRVGLRTPARGYLIAGMIIVALTLLIPLIGLGLSTESQGSGVTGAVGMVMFMPGDLVIRGTFPIVLIGFGLCFLAWAERSIGLAIIAAVYLALSLVASLYDIENLFYYAFGSGISAAASGLPNVLLPALVLLLSGAGAWLVQRRQHAPPAED
jgi:hypothetical protein